MSEWRYIDHGTEGNRIRLDGIDVWKHDWVRLGDERAVATDPKYGQEFHFPVYRITHRGRTVEFAAGEYANGVWGFYMRESPPGRTGDE